MNTHKIISQNLLRLRKKSGYKQNVVADILGVSESFYGKIERGDSVLDIDKIPLLVDFYKASLDDFFKDESKLELNIETNNGAAGNNPIYYNNLNTNEIDLLQSQVNDLKSQIVNKDKQIEHLQETVTYLKNQSAV